MNTFVLSCHIASFLLASHAFVQLSPFFPWLLRLVPYIVTACSVRGNSSFPCMEVIVNCLGTSRLYVFCALKMRYKRRK